MTAGRRRWRGEEHPLINQLWERASRLTMIPEHDGDSWLKYHVETSWKKPMLRCALCHCNACLPSASTTD